MRQIPETIHYVVYDFVFHAQIDVHVSQSHIEVYQYDTLFPLRQYRAQIYGKHSFARAAFT